MKNKIAVVAILALAIAGGVAYWAYQQSSGELVSSRAWVEGPVVEVGSAVAGVVDQAFVSVGDTVIAGQPLFALDKATHEARLASERSRLAEIAATLPPKVMVPSPVAAYAQAPGKPLAVLQVEEEEARLAVEKAAYALATASVELARVESGSSSAHKVQGDPKYTSAIETRDMAASALQRAKDSYEKISYARAQREQLEKQSRAQNGPVSAALAARIAEYQAQVSRVRLAEQDLARTLVFAPKNGLVVKQNATPGLVVAVGEAPVHIVPDEARNLWVVAYFPLAAAESLHEGQKCSVTLEGETPVSGHVAEVLPVRELDREVAVRIILDDNDAVTLEAGREASVSVKTGARPFWAKSSS